MAEGDPCAELQQQSDSFSRQFENTETDGLQAESEFNSAKSRRDPLQKEVDGLQEQLENTQRRQQALTAEILDLQNQFLDVLQAAAPFKGELEALRLELDKPEVRNNPELFAVLLERFNMLTCRCSSRRCVLAIDSSVSAFLTRETDRVVVT